MKNPAIKFTFLCIASAASCLGQIVPVNPPGGGGLGPVVLTGVPSVGQAPVATSATTATWQTPPSGTGCTPGATSNILKGDGAGGCTSAGIAADAVVTGTGPANSILRFGTAPNVSGFSSLLYYDTPLSVPNTPVLTTNGTAGITTYRYAVVANGLLGYSQSSTVASIATGPAALTGVNSVSVASGAVTNSTSCDFYRVNANGLSAYLAQQACGTTYVDIGTSISTPSATGSQPVNLVDSSAGVLVNQNMKVAGQLAVGSATMGFIPSAGVDSGSAPFSVGATFTGGSGAIPVSDNTLATLNMVVAPTADNQVSQPWNMQIATLVPSSNTHSFSALEGVADTVTINGSGGVQSADGYLGSLNVGGSVATGFGDPVNPSIVGLNQVISMSTSGHLNGVAAVVRAAMNSGAGLVDRADGFRFMSTAGAGHITDLRPLAIDAPVGGSNVINYCAMCVEDGSGAGTTSTWGLWVKGTSWKSKFDGALQAGSLQLTTTPLPTGSGGTGSTGITGIRTAHGASPDTVATPGTDYVVPSGSITGNAATASALAAQTTCPASGTSGSITFTDTNAACSIFTVTMTGNITGITLTGMREKYPYLFQFTENATGGWTVSGATNFVTFPTMITTLNVTTQFLATYDGTNMNVQPGNNNSGQSAAPLGVAATAAPGSGIVCWVDPTDLLQHCANTGTAFTSNLPTNNLPTMVNGSSNPSDGKSILYIDVHGAQIKSKVVMTQCATACTLTIADGKTLTVSNSITLIGTDGTSMTFPTTSATIARTDAAQTFVGLQTFGTPIALGSGGTNGTDAASNGGIVWSNATGYKIFGGTATAGLPLLSGSNATPSWGTKTGNTTQFASWNGATTASRCVDTDGSGNLQITPSDCGTSASTTPGSTYFSSTANAGPNNTASETSIIGTLGSGSKTISANTFTAGALLQQEGHGYVSGKTTLTDNLTFKGKCGSTVIWSAVVTGTLLNTFSQQPFSIRVTTVAVGAGAGGTFVTNDFALVTSSTLTAAIVAKILTTSPVAYDFTTSCNYDMTATWAGADPAEIVVGTNVAAYSPGAPVTTVNGQTGTVNVNSGAAAHSTAINQGNGNPITGVGPCPSGQIQLGVASADPACSDFPDVKIIPAANCNNATAGASWSLPASNAPVPACFAGTNNLGGVLQFVDTSVAQFDFELPLDWDAASQPYVNLFFGSAANTSGTVIFNVAAACSKADGSITSDPAFTTAFALPTKTMAAATRGWSTSGQLTAITSGNNCVPGGTVIFKITRATDTATTLVNVSKAVITTPRLLAVQGN